MRNRKRPSVCAVLTASLSHARSLSLPEVQSLNAAYGLDPHFLRSLGHALRGYYQGGFRRTADGVSSHRPGFAQPAECITVKRLLGVAPHLFSSLSAAGWASHLPGYSLGRVRLPGNSIVAFDIHFNPLKFFPDREIAGRRRGPKAETFSRPGNSPINFANQSTASYSL